tara:strand:+ start:611 stop:829 length:219 start_codon:yes stop_codon:yes gene_type:complete
MNISELKQRVLNGALSAVDGWKKPVVINVNHIDKAKKALKPLRPTNMTEQEFDNKINTFLFNLLHDDSEPSG